MKLLPAETFAHLRQSWAWKYRIGLEEVVPTETPGYWRKVEPCSGAAGRCASPLHGFMGCAYGIRHTVTYYDNIRDERGRFASPYRTWKLAREAFLLGRWPS